MGRRRACDPNGQPYQVPQAHASAYFRPASLRIDADRLCVGTAAVVYTVASAAVGERELRRLTGAES